MILSIYIEFPVVLYLPDLLTYVQFLYDEASESISMKNKELVKTNEKRTLQNH